MLRGYHQTYSIFNTYLYASVGEYITPTRVILYDIKVYLCCTGLNPRLDLHLLGKTLS